MRKKKKCIPKVKKINQADLSGLLERARSNTLTLEDCDSIQGMAETIEFIITMLNDKDIQLKRLLKQILGIKSEKSKKIFDKENAAVPDADPPSDDIQGETKNNPDKNQERKGHGRNGVECYTGADHIFIAHPTLSNGAPCLECPKGKVYKEKKPGVFIFIEGRAPIKATVYELEKLRCNLCGAIFQASLPEKMAGENHGSKHYDESAKTMMVLLRYGYGFPLSRLTRLQADLGMPLAVATGWDKSEEVADKIHPAFEALKHYGAQGEILHNDDTGMKILSTMKVIQEEVKNADGKKVRTGIFTTGIISITDSRKCALFFTGRKHAGENFGDLLAHREQDRSAPVLMCDAKNGNIPKGSDAIVCNCTAHARRYFVDVAENYPDECAYVIVDVYQTIYKNEAITQKNPMSADERLRFHQKESAPVMEAFHQWLKEQFDKRKVEPNSDLGTAITYVLNHWPELTRFLFVPGVPIDNNICERMLKTGICHRKNSLFYKTEHGAYIGDMFMSLIHTCRLNDENPFDYITALQKQSSDVFRNPTEWMPWNYKDRLESMFADPKT